MAKSKVQPIRYDSRQRLWGFAKDRKAVDATKQYWHKQAGADMAGALLMDQVRETYDALTKPVLHLVGGSGPPRLTQTQVEVALLEARSTKCIHEFVVDSAISQCKHMRFGLNGGPVEPPAETSDDSESAATAQGSPGQSGVYGSQMGFDDIADEFCEHRWDQPRKLYVDPVRGGPAIYKPIDEIEFEEKELTVFALDQRIGALTSGKDKLVKELTLVEDAWAKAYRTDPHITFREMRERCGLVKPRGKTG